MISHGVSLGHHPFHQLRAGFQVIPHQEKRGGGAVFFQRVQDGRGIAVFIPRVKSQINNLFVCVLGVVGVKLL